ncbi:hypothetical protein AABB24_021612 [Solanum stoloniferum]|uniref:NAC domain-containing protein n=1 Tax=Solanum stoloniferum TaxID=62892 RepID=A0ABD2SVW8_9SOLN
MCYMNKGYKQENGHWLMKEYDLSTYILDKFDKDCRDYVLCATKKRTLTKDTMKLMNVVAEECTNLEDQSSGTVETTSYDEALQAQLELLSNMQDETNMVVEPLSSPDTFEAMSMLDIDFDVLLELDCLGSITDSLCSY